MPTKVMLHKKSSKQYTNLAVVQELYAHTGELAGRLVSCLVSFPTVCLDAMTGLAWLVSCMYPHSYQLLWKQLHCD